MWMRTFRACAGSVGQMPARYALPDHLLMERRHHGLRILALREAKGWSQEILAEHAGLDRQTIGRMETSVRGVSIDAYLLVADALGVPLWRLFRDE